jgi:SRSO17 transposase
LKQIAGLGKKLVAFLVLFRDCFGRREPRELLRIYIQGQLSDLEHKTAEGIALSFGIAPRTLQRFLESIKWDEEKFHDRCQQMVAREHSHAEAIGVVDESGVGKSGDDTVGVKRQWNGNRGKVDNCVVGVHLSYAAPGFQCLLGSRLYLPEEWANDPARREKNHVPEEVEFRTKPQIALELIDRALGNGVRVVAWTFDEFYGRDGKFLDGLEERRQAFVGEVPSDFHGWVQRPEVLRSGPKNGKKGGRRKHYPRLPRRRPACEVRNLAKYSPLFQEQSWQRYRIKDTDKGPEVWEIKWAVFWRKGEDGLPGRRQCLIVARNVLTGEMKYFVANRVPGEKGATVRWLLRVAFGRWSVERCFREAKKELGMDHYQVRGWRCLHRHFYLTQASHLFCARVRQEYDGAENEQVDRLTIEAVRSATNTWLSAADLKPAARRQRYETEVKNQRYYQRRNRQSRKSHTKTRIARLNALGIHVNKIKSCVPRQPQPLRTPLAGQKL